MAEKRGKCGRILFDLEHCVTETVDIETAPLSVVNEKQGRSVNRLRTLVGRGSAAF